MIHLKVKKLHPDAVLPKYARPGDAAMDLVAFENPDYMYSGMGGEYWRYRTGIAIEVPPGYVGLIFPRSSISNMTISLTNSVGVIDSGYRGEIEFRFKEHDKSTLGHYRKGDRIGQLMIIPYPQVQVMEVGQLSDTERGSNGYGSTGR